MASGTDIGNTDRHPIVEHIKQFTNEYAGVQRDRFTGFQIDVTSGFGAQQFDAFDQFVALIIGTGEWWPPPKLSHLS